MDGSAYVGRASVNCPFLKYPITNFGGAVFFEDGMLRIEGLDARVGRRGHVHLKGALPVVAARRCGLNYICDSRLVEILKLMYWESESKLFQI